MTDEDAARDRPDEPTPESAAVAAGPAGPARRVPRVSSGAGARRRRTDPVPGASPIEQSIWPGRPYPLGATYDGVGTNFSLFSEAADRVELCLFDTYGRERRYELPSAAPTSITGT